jgi:LacI family transcriptional regulator
VPDPALARLAAWRWGHEQRVSEGSAVAVLTDSKRHNLPDYSERRIEGLRGQAHALGYGVEILHLRDFDWNAIRLAEVLKARGIRGILVERIDHPGSFSGFPWEEFAAISCGLGEEHLPISTVTNDVHAGIRMFWAIARERGYRRIGVILEFEGKPDPYYRVLSATKLEQAERLPDEAVIPPLTLKDHDSPAEAHQTLRAWIDENSPDVILSNRKILIYMKEMQIRVPEDMACATYALRMDEPSILSGVRSNLLAVGELAMDLCNLALQSPPRKEKPVQVLHLVEPEWVEGKTFPCLRSPGPRTDFSRSGTCSPRRSGA